MRTRILVPLLAAGALVLAGCAEEDAAPGGGAPTSEPSDGGSDGPGDDAGPDGDAEEPGGTDEPDSGAFHTRAEEIAHAWPDRPEPLPDPRAELWWVEAVAATGPEDTELKVVIPHGACDVDWGAWLHETDELVVVAAWTAENPEIEACTEQVVLDDVTVELAKPLGDRTVLDAVGVGDPRELDHTMD
jgi:hypothetical protein